MWFKGVTTATFSSPAECMLSLLTAVVSTTSSVNSSSAATCLASAMDMDWQTTNVAQARRSSWFLEIVSEHFYARLELTSEHLPIGPKNVWMDGSRWRRKWWVCCVFWRLFFCWMRHVKVSKVKTWASITVTGCATHTQTTAERVSQGSITGHLFVLLHALARHVSLTRPRPRRTRLTRPQ